MLPEETSTTQIGTMIKDQAEAIRIAREHMKRFGKWDNVNPEVKQAYENGFTNGLMCNTEYYQNHESKTFSKEPNI